MRTALVAIGVVATLIAAFILWRIRATFSGGRAAYLALAGRIEPVERSLQAGADPAPGHLERFARDRETRKVLYEALERHGKMHLFPSQYLTQDALAEADLVLWLAHPNELAATPDEIEMTAALPAPGKGFEGQQYFLFRYRTNPPHWAAKDGWLAGVSGPFPVNGPLSVGASGTFSRFEAYDARTPEEHVRVVHELVAGRQ
jgi:hypothetical protein